MSKLLMLKLEDDINPIETILPKTLETIQKYYKDWQIVGINNLTSLKESVIFPNKEFGNIIKKQKLTLKLIPEISTIYFCPWKRGEDISCYWVKKTNVSNELTNIPNLSFLSIRFKIPSAGMLLRAMYDEGDEFEQVIYVGDNLQDEEVAYKANITFLSSETFYK